MRRSASSRARPTATRVPLNTASAETRHTHATALLLAGVPVHVVSRRLGHADVQTTLETYAHVTELRTGQPITFRGLARHAGVSLDFLYSSTALRQRIQQLRDQRTQPGGASSRGDTTGGDPAGVASPETTSSVVATLTAQLTDLRRRHREETARLRRELEAAHGENLLLRRRLTAGHDPASRETS